MNNKKGMQAMYNLFIVQKRQEIIIFTLKELYIIR